MINICKYIFILMIYILPSLGIMTISSNTVITSENRIINQFPSFSDSNFFVNLQKYFNDRILFKIPISEKLHHIFRDYFSEDKFSKNNITIEGKKGWLFFSDWNISDVYLQHTFPLEVDNNLVAKKISSLESIKNYNNVPFYFIVGPDKHTIYTEYMDQNFGHPGKFRLFDKVKTALQRSDINLIDTSDIILSEKNILDKYKKTLYYSDDTHWNLYGGYTAFNFVMQEILLNYVPYQYNFTFIKHKNGDLVKAISQPSTNVLDDCIVSKAQSTSILKNKLFDSNSELQYLQDYKFHDFNSLFINKAARDNRTIMVISDSFGINMQPFFIDYFYKVIYVFRSSDTEIIKSVIDKYYPDLILYVNVERNVLN